MSYPVFGAGTGRPLLIDYGKQLNQEQLDVVLHGDGPCLVLAGAGWLRSLHRCDSLVVRLGRHVVALEGEGFRVELARKGERLVVAVNDFSNCTNLTQPTDYLLMREELGIARRDPVFEKTLASAAALAYPNDK